MLKLRTTKEVETNLHTLETYRVEFRYRYERNKSNTFKVKVDAYKILVDDFEFIPGGNSYRVIEDGDIDVLLEQAEAITPVIEGEHTLEHFDRVIASGIKLVIISEQLWKGKLAIGDFE